MMVTTSQSGSMRSTTTLVQLKLEDWRCDDLSFVDLCLCTIDAMQIIDPVFFIVWVENLLYKGI